MHGVCTVTKLKYPFLQVFQPWRLLERANSLFGSRCQFSPRIGHCRTNYSVNEHVLVQCLPFVVNGNPFPPFIVQTFTNRKTVRLLLFSMHTSLSENIFCSILLSIPPQPVFLLSYN